MRRNGQVRVFPVDDLRQDADGLVAVLTASREAEDSGFTQEIRKAGGSVAWLLDAVPRLASLAEDPPTEADLRFGTRGCYLDAEARLTLCDTCPGHGGACAKVSQSRFEPGERPVWVRRSLGGTDRTVLTVEPAACEKWAEYQLRHRLCGIGVPAKYAGATTRDFRTSHDTAARVAAYQRAVATGERPWLLLTGPRGSGKTHLAVAVLRNVLRKVPRTLGYFVDLLGVRAEARRLYDEHEKRDLFAVARQAAFLVVDDLDPSRHEAWFHERVEALLRERFLADKATLLTSHESLDDLAATYTTINGLGGIEQCRL
jgi:DNA replication protein DnaC